MAETALAHSKQSPAPIAGWQGIAGVSFAVTPKVTLALDGRVKGSFSHFNSPGSVPGKPITQFNYETRSIFASVRYSFD